VATLHTVLAASDREPVRNREIVQEGRNR
jgi:hypothetical protein